MIPPHPPPCPPPTNSQHYHGWNYYKVKKNTWRTRNRGHPGYRGNAPPPLPQPTPTPPHPWSWRELCCLLQSQAGGLSLKPKCTMITPRLARMAQCCRPPRCVTPPNAWSLSQLPHTTQWFSGPTVQVPNLPQHNSEVLHFSPPPHPPPHPPPPHHHHHHPSPTPSAESQKVYIFYLIDESLTETAPPQYQKPEEKQKVKKPTLFVSPRVHVQPALIFVVTMRWEMTGDEGRWWRVTSWEDGEGVLLVTRLLLV